MNILDEIKKRKEEIALLEKQISELEEKYDNFGHYIDKWCKLVQVKDNNDEAVYFGYVTDVNYSNGTFSVLCEPLYCYNYNPYNPCLLCSKQGIASTDLYVRDGEGISSALLVIDDNELDELKKSFNNHLNSGSR